MADVQKPTNNNWADDDDFDSDEEEVEFGLETDNQKAQKKEPKQTVRTKNHLLLYPLYLSQNDLN